MGTAAGVKDRKDHLWGKSWDQESSYLRKELMKGRFWEPDDRREPGAREGEQIMARAWLWEPSQPSKQVAF